MVQQVVCSRGLEMGRYVTPEEATARTLREHQARIASQTHVQGETSTASSSWTLMGEHLNQPFYSPFRCAGISGRLLASFPL